MGHTVIQLNHIAEPLMSNAINNCNIFSSTIMFVKILFCYHIYIVNLASFHDSLLTAQNIDVCLLILTFLDKEGCFQCSVGGAWGQKQRKE